MTPTHHGSLLELDLGHRDRLMLNMLKTKIRQPAMTGICESIDRSCKMRKSDNILADEIPLIYKIIYFRN